MHVIDDALSDQIRALTSSSLSEPGDYACFTDGLNPTPDIEQPLVGIFSADGRTPKLVLSLTDYLALQRELASPFGFER